MATVGDVKGTNNFCDSVYSELAGMKRRIMDLRENTLRKGRGNDVIALYDKHLCELIDEIDWKLQILAHSCSYEWQGSTEYEDAVQVEQSDKIRESEFAPGYLGG